MTISESSRDESLQGEHGKTGLKSFISSYEAHGKSGSSSSVTQSQDIRCSGSAQYPRQTWGLAGRDRSSSRDPPASPCNYSAQRAREILQNTNLQLTNVSFTCDGLSHCSCYILTKTQVQMCRRLPCHSQTFASHMAHLHLTTSLANTLKTTLHCTRRIPS